MMNSASLATLAVHAGQSRAKPDFTPIATPIYNAVTYGYSSAQELDAVFAGERDGFVYHRYGNPTTSALEDAVAQIEGTEGAVACASGMAAIHLALLAAGARAGATVLAAQDLYGHSFALLSKVLSAQGVRVHFVDMADLSAVAAAAAQLRPAILYAETLSNPLLKVANIPALAQHAHDAGAVLVVDNTFAAPCLYRPSRDGADYVVYSATKYHGGHGDVMGGLIAASAERCAAARELHKLVGGVIGPNESWLILRGLKTFVLRSRQQCHSAAVVAAFLSAEPRVSQVLYPGLPSHPQFPLARRLFSSDLYGGIVSFEIRGAGREQVFRFMDSLQLVAPLTSLGDVYSLLLYPAHSSHRLLTEQQRRDIGISPSLVRLSLGIEDAADIIADLHQALDQIGLQTAPQ
jgi:cystathionine beta-lyase/cystathionine gamma-synthase